MLNAMQNQTEKNLITSFDLLRHQYVEEQEQLRDKYQKQFLEILSAIQRLHDVEETKH